MENIGDIRYKSHYGTIIIYKFKFTEIIIWFTTKSKMKLNKEKSLEYIRQK